MEEIERTEAKMGYNRGLGCIEACSLDEEEGHRGALIETKEHRLPYRFEDGRDDEIGIRLGTPLP